MNPTSKTTFRMRDDLHVMRKLWHMATGLLGLLAYSTSSIQKIEMAQVLLGVAVTAFIVEFTRFRSEQVNEVVMKLMGPFMRESERNGFSGFPFYALGTSLSLFLFNEKIAILSILFLIFSDPISSFFGILLGRDKILPNKSLQGSLAGFITCYLVTLLYLRYYGMESLASLGFAMCAGIVGAISELFSVFVDDNLTIPVLSGLGLTLINEIFIVFF
ncbi:MAG: SEC59/DGK1/VTE5 family protein [Halobacteriovoraceae bacterium]|nr:SEC59/DGK1/VTE5 family protein [Halobacteriovoraceae bacterium]